jgi:hypothetical protein
MKETLTARTVRSLVPCRPDKSETFGYTVGTMTAADPAPYPRRLSDKLLAAFGQACDQGHIEVAELLLKAIEIVLTVEAAPAERERRTQLGPVIEAFGRLKALREKADTYSNRA